MHRSRHRREWRYGAARQARPAPSCPAYTPRLRCADRKSLLLGTALASTLLIGTMLAPAPAAAVACIQPASPNPINDTEATFITCVNTEPRINAAGNAIQLTTTGTGSYIDLYNSGVLKTTNTNNSFMSAILANTQGPSSPIAIENVAAITATNNGTGNALAVRAFTTGVSSSIDIVNSGEMRAYSQEAGAVGLYGATQSGSVSIENSGDITVTGFFGAGIRGIAGGAPLHIANAGDIVATGNQLAVGIYAETFGLGGAIAIENQGDIFLRANSSFYGRARGIYVDASGDFSPVSVVNSGDITAIGNDAYVTGIRVETRNYSPVSIVNSGVSQ